MAEFDLYSTIFMEALIREKPRVYSFLRDRYFGGTPSIFKTKKVIVDRERQLYVGGCFDPGADGHDPLPVRAADGQGMKGKRERSKEAAIKRLGFTNTLALLLVMLLFLGLAGGFLLAVLSIRYSYTGALACYTVVFTPISTALSVVLARVVDKNRAENTGADGKGVVFAKAEAAGFQDSPPI